MLVVGVVAVLTHTFPRDGCFGKLQELAGPYRLGHMASGKDRQVQRQAEQGEGHGRHRGDLFEAASEILSISQYLLYQK